MSDNKTAALQPNGAIFRVLKENVANLEFIFR